MPGQVIGPSSLKREYPRVVTLPRFPSFGNSCAGAPKVEPGVDMANIKSQIKRIGTNEAARNRNRSVRSALRTYIKRVHTAVDAGDLEEAEVALRRAGKEIDKAASKG